MTAMQYTNITSYSIMLYIINYDDQYNNLYYIHRRLTERPLISNTHHVTCKNKLLVLCTTIINILLKTSTRLL